jgi:hypothetical protein
VSTAAWWKAVLLALLFASPWIAAIAWLWSRRPRDGSLPPSMAEQARKRLWS